MRRHDGQNNPAAGNENKMKHATTLSFVAAFAAASAFADATSDATATAVNLAEAIPEASAGWETKLSAGVETYSGNTDKDGANGRKRVGHVHRQRRAITEHRHAQGVADKHYRNARLVRQPREARVVRSAATELLDALRRPYRSHIPLFHGA